MAIPIVKILIYLRLHCSVLGLTNFSTNNSVRESTENSTTKELNLPTGNSTFVLMHRVESNDTKTVSDTLTNNTANFGELLEIWNPKSIARIWKSKGGNVNVSSTCNKDITRYFNGISRGNKWALKMHDADGKRTWGFFMDNKYWVGAPNLCREMEREYGKLQGNEGTLWHMGTPPFSVSANSVNLELEIFEPGIEGRHNMTLGLCLPTNCNVPDVMQLLNFAANESRKNDASSRITFNYIRNLSTGYSLWDDSTFYVLLTAFALAFILVLLGTLYDVVLRYRVLRRREMRRDSANAMTEMKNSSANFDEEITISRLWSVKEHNGSLDICNPKDVPKPLSETLLAFSLLLNISKLGSLDVGADTLAPIHGLRVLSLLWVIMVHTCLILNEVSDSKTFRTKAEDHFLYQTISNGTYAVDTFFFMSGCLVSFLYFRTMAKQIMNERAITRSCFGQFLQFLGMMWYRYFRLTPPYLLVIGLIQVSMKWYHDHSMIEFPSFDHQTCERFWWRNALYINTYFPMEDRCVVWSWYLANDTQFYTVGIIILIIAASYFTIGAAAAIFFLVTSWITTAVITLNTNHIPTIQDPFAHYESLYDKPWTRIGPYLIGMITGWLLFKINCKVNMNKAVIIFGWIISIFTMSGIVYGIYGNTFGPVSSAMYTSLSHSGWSLSVAWILVACVTGHGGLVNKFLSWKYLYPVSRLTYCAYLVHPALLRAIILTGENSIHLTHGLVATLYFGNVTTSYAVSLFLSLFFEAPMVSLLRIVHPLRQWKRD